jgi:hypothetical protein
VITNELAYLMIIVGFSGPTLSVACAYFAATTATSIIRVKGDVGISDARTRSILTDLAERFESWRKRAAYSQLLALIIAGAFFVLSIIVYYFRCVR